MRSAKTNEEAHLLLNETIEYYKTNPRSMDGNACCYTSITGAHCALGRLLNEEELRTVNDVGINMDGIWELMDVIEPDINHNSGEYRLLGDLQALHDGHQNWTTKEGGELTEEGQELVYEIRRQIDRNYFPINKIKKGIKVTVDDGETFSE